MLNISKYLGSMGLTVCAITFVLIYSHENLKKGNTYGKKTT